MSRVMTARVRPAPISRRPTGRAADCYSACWRFESSRESRGVHLYLSWPCSSEVEHHSVKVRGAGSNPVAVATPWSFMICQGDRIPVVKRRSYHSTKVVLPGSNPARDAMLRAACAARVKQHN
jgi:hypothetical protein